jgi:hypothetical protein
MITILSQGRVCMPHCPLRVFAFWLQCLRIQQVIYSPLSHPQLVNVMETKGSSAVSHYCKLSRFSHGRPRNSDVNVTASFCTQHIAFPHSVFKTKYIPAFLRLAGQLLWQLLWVSTSQTLHVMFHSILLIDIRDKLEMKAKFS